MSDWIDSKKKSISQQRAEGSLYPDDLDEEQSDGGLAKVETREALIEKRAPAKLAGSPGHGKTNYLGGIALMAKERAKELEKEPLKPLSITTLSQDQTPKDVGGRTFIFSNMSIAGDASNTKIGGIPLKTKLSSRKDAQQHTGTDKPKGPKA